MDASEPRDFGPEDTEFLRTYATILGPVIDRRHKVRRLLTTEERLRRVVETEAVGVIFFDQAGTVVDSNDVFLRMTGYTRADIVAGTLTWRRMTPPEWVEASEAEMAAFPRIGRTGPYEKEYLLADGSRRWMLFAGRDLGDGTVAEHCIDISSRKQAEASLRESEERFRSFAENLASTLWILDADTLRLEYLSPAFEAMWGEGRDAVMADLSRWTALLHPEDRERAKRGMPQLLAGETYQQTYRIIRPSDGAVRHIQDTGFPIRDAAGKVRRIVGIAQDITEARQVEQRLRDSEARQRVLIEGLLSRFANLENGFRR